MLLQEGQESTEILITCFPALSQKKKKKVEESHFPGKLALIAHVYGTWQGCMGYFMRYFLGTFGGISLGNFVKMPTLCNNENLTLRTV